MNEPLLLTLGSILFLILAVVLLPAAKVRVVALGVIRLLMHVVAFVGLLVHAIFFFNPSYVPPAVSLSVTHKSVFPSGAEGQPGE